jgi:hypothetical protein
VLRTDIEVPITLYGTGNIYTYDTKKLLISYGVMDFSAIIHTIIGLHSLYTNGVQHSTSFSSILFTTRNPELNTIAAGQSLGTKPLPKEIRNRRLMFGTLDKMARKISLEIPGMLRSALMVLWIG